MNWLKAILAATLITALFIVIVYLAVYYAGLLLTLMAYGVLLLMFLGLVLILWKSLRNGLRSMSPRGLTPQKENNKMSTVCSKCNQAYLETHVCTVETNQSFNKPLAMKLTQILIKHGFTHPFPIQALLAAHQSELDLAVKQARIKELESHIEWNSPGAGTIHLTTYEVQARLEELTKGEQD